MNDTPETDAMALSDSRTDHNWRQLCRKLERERDEAIDAMKTCRRVSREDCEQNAKRAEKLHVQNLTLERERDEAQAALMKIEDLFIDGTDTWADRENMGLIARAALEGVE